MMLGGYLKLFNTIRADGRNGCICKMRIMPVLARSHSNRVQLSNVEH